ncbi:hypothetical protein [Nocardioides alcanivorans]|nr:hypothetical protein [Nocardioides alcanivorans]
MTVVGAASVAVLGWFVLRTSAVGSSAVLEGSPVVEPVETKERQ